MASFSSPSATIGVLIAQYPGVPGASVSAHHAAPALGAGMVFFIVMAVVLFAAFARVARELASLYSQLMRVLAAVTSVVFAVVLVAGVSVTLLIRR